MPQEEVIKKNIEEAKPEENLATEESLKEMPVLDLGKSFEKLPEKNNEQEKEVSEEISATIKESNSANTGIAPATSRAEREKKIEEFLSDGLDGFYLKMDRTKQLEFKRKGEETANEINKLFDKAKVRANKIIELIKKWLSLIPGVSKFFLEQEAKIRADKIIKLKKMD